jgi:hypothetical protein
MEQDSAARNKHWQIIRKTRFAIFVTREAREPRAPNEGGEILRSRPLTTIQKEFDGTQPKNIGEHRQLQLHST